MHQEMLSADVPHLGDARPALGGCMDRTWEKHVPRVRFMGRQLKQILMLWHKAVFELSTKAMIYALYYAEPAQLIAKDVISNSHFVNVIYLIMPIRFCDRV